MCAHVCCFSAFSSSHLLPERRARHAAFNQINQPCLSGNELYEAINSPLVNDALENRCRQIAQQAMPNTITSIDVMLGAAAVAVPCVILLPLLATCAKTDLHLIMSLKTLFFLRVRAQC